MSCSWEIMQGEIKKKTRPLDASSFWEIRPRACWPLRSTSQEVPTPPSSEIQGRVGNLHAPDEKKTSVLFCLKEQTPSSEQNSKVYRRPDACLSRLWVEIEKGNPARHRSYRWVSQETVNLESRISNLDGNDTAREDSPKAIYSKLSYKLVFYPSLVA